MSLGWLTPCFFLLVLTIAICPILAQSTSNSGPQGSFATPLGLPGAGVNLNPVGAPGARLINNANLGAPPTLPNQTSPVGGSPSNLNFGTQSIGRLSPPAGSSGISGIGRLGPPGNEPGLTVTPNLSGPPSLSPATFIAPISNPAASIAPGTGGGQGGLGFNSPPGINPTNPVGNTFQANPTGSSGLRNPSNNFRQ